MGQDRDDHIGKENEKVPDSEIQGTKGGQRNRAEKEAGSMPPPAGETRQTPDPRTPERHQGNG